MKSLGLLVVAAAAAVSSAVPAQARKFDLQLFKPEPNQATGSFLGTPASSLDAGEFSAGFYLNYANDPLVVHGRDGKRLASIVGSQWGLDVIGAIGLHRRIEIGLDVPLVLAQDGESLAYVPSAPNAGFGIGDVRLQPKVLIYGERGDDGPQGFALSAAADVFIPTGNRKKYQGEQGFRIQPKLAAELRIPRWVSVLGNVGYLVRPAAQVGNVDINDMITWTVGGAIYLTEKLQAVTDINGQASVLADKFHKEELPLEWLLGGKYWLTKNLSLSGGLGLGLVRGVGAPDYRLLAGLNWSQLDTGPKDKDGDGLLDKDDQCPNEPEDRDSFQDDDGCPDPDNDGDGVLDVQDGAPNDPEDKDSFQDEDGVPDPDNDNDGVLDAADKCPDKPETLNGFQDDDGCPDTGGKVLLTCEKIEIKDKVYFETGSAKIKAKSFSLLDQVSAVVKQAWQIKKLRVEGHTDDRGNDAMNLKLSQDRADSVRDYLVAHGVDTSRIEAIGYGEVTPIASNRTARGRETNRRVEFVVAERSGECTSAPVK